VARRRSPSARTAQALLKAQKKQLKIIKELNREARKLTTTFQGVSSGGGAGRPAGGGGGGGGGALALVGTALSSLKILALAFEAGSKAIESSSTVAAEAMSGMAGEFRVASSAIQIFSTTAGTTQGQLENFAQAGIDIPDEVISRLNQVNLARTVRSVELTNRVEVNLVGNGVADAIARVRALPDAAAALLANGGAGQ